MGVRVSVLQDAKVLEICCSQQYVRNNVNIVITELDTEKWLRWCPGQMVQLIRALSREGKVAGLIPRQGTYMNHPMNA